MKPKLTLRDWLWAQHVPAELQADLEKLFALPRFLNAQAAMPGLPDEEAAILRDCAKGIEAILGEKT